MSIESLGFSCEDDSLYFDPSMDYAFALNNSVREEEESRKEFSRDTISY